MQVVLCPFPRANSEQHLVATKGGVNPTATETLIEAQNQLAIAQQNLAYLQNLVYAPHNQGRVDGLRATAAATEIIRAENVALAQQRVREQTWVAWRGVSDEDLVCTDDPALDGLLNRLAQADDQLYIHGHCAKGADILQSADKTLTIDVVALVDLLDGRLNKLFPGRIKIFACESALDVVKRDSFAVRFADEMVNRGWVNARIIGYSANVQTGTVDPQGYKVAENGQRTTGVQVRVYGQIRAAQSCCAIM